MIKFMIEGLSVMDGEVECTYVLEHETLTEALVDARTQYEATRGAAAGTRIDFTGFELSNFKEPTFDINDK